MIYRSLAPLFDSGKLDRELRAMIRDTFAEFCAPSTPTTPTTPTLPTPPEGKYLASSWNLHRICICFSLYFRSDNMLTSKQFITGMWFVRTLVKTYKTFVCLFCFVNPIFVVDGKGEIESSNNDHGPPLQRLPSEDATFSDEEEEDRCKL